MSRGPSFANMSPITFMKGRDHSSSDGWITEAEIHLLSPGDGFKWVVKAKVIGKRAKTLIPANEIIY
jgi:hypothetical protein